MENDRKRSELKGIVNRIKQKYERNQYNPVYGELWMSIARLVENSDFGKNSAESELVLKVSEEDKKLKMFEKTSAQLFERSNEMLGRYGNVSIGNPTEQKENMGVKLKFEPYGKGRE